jgi:hypothetical protein
MLFKSHKDIHKVTHKFHKGIQVTQSHSGTHLEEKASV